MKLALEKMEKIQFIILEEIWESEPLGEAETVMKTVLRWLVYLQPHCGSSCDPGKFNDFPGPGE